jgi:hypothetical protein
MNIIEVPGTNYVVLPDGTVARKLKPTIKKEKNFWYLHVGNPSKLVRFTQDEVVAPDVMTAKISRYIQETVE